jgi:hypothetical protein
LIDQVLIISVVFIGYLLLTDMNGILLQCCDTKKAMPLKLQPHFTVLTLDILIDYLAQEQVDSIARLKFSQVLMRTETHLSLTPVSKIICPYRPSIMLDQLHKNKQATLMTRVFGLDV